MKNVLIAYATWAGSTHEIAEEIAKTLRKKSFHVDINSTNEVQTLSDYNALILGTSIHAGQTVRGFRKFIRKYYEVLQEKPIALFVSCANMMEDTEENRAETMEWLKKAIKGYEELQPISIGLFAGATLTTGEDFDNLNFLVRKLIIAMEKNMINNFGKSDFRDFEKIRLWADQLAKVF